MVIGAGPKLLRLAVKILHHERIENADLLQCCHIAMDASERCVETVEEIVDVFICARVFGTLIKSGSAMGRLSLEGDLWLGLRSCLNTARPVLCVMYLDER